MIGLNSFQTFSGLLAFAALVAVLNHRLTSAGILFTIAGAGGVGVFWERWSRLTGHDASVRAVFAGVPPTDGQLWLLGTHFPVMVLGVVMLAGLAWKHAEGRPDALAV